MALSNPRAYYGVHSVSPYSRTTGEFEGTVRVLGDSSLSLSGELVDLNGGSNKYPWATEDSLISSELSLTFREYPDFVYKLFLGKAPTDIAAEASGNTSAIANKFGTSAVSATVGIASATTEAGQETDLKFARYVVKVVSATTVDVYASSDIDFARGDDLSFQDDLLKITASALTVPDTGGTVSIPNTGVELTGGSGTVAMTIGDTATFETRPISTVGATTLRVGATSDVFPEFGAVVLAKQRGNGEMFELDLFRVKSVGLPIGLAENTFSEAAVTARVLYDSDKDGVFDMRHVRP